MADEFQKLSRPPLQNILGKLVHSPSGGMRGGDSGDVHPGERYLNDRAGIAPSGGMAVGTPGGKLTEAEAQQLAQYLYSLGHNVEFLRENGVGTSPSDEDGGGDDDPSQPGDPDLGLLVDLSGSTLFPFTYGLLYDNRNEFTARTSSGGAWVAEYDGVMMPIVKQSAYDFDIPI